MKPFSKKRQSKKQKKDKAREVHALYVRKWRGKLNKDGERTAKLRILLRESIRKDNEGKK